MIQKLSKGKSRNKKRQSLTDNKFSYIKSQVSKKLIIKEKVIPRVLFG